MHEDGLLKSDVEEALSGGQRVTKQKDTLDRTEHIVDGETTGLRRVRSICRLSDSADFVIITTVWKSEHEEEL